MNSSGPIRRHQSLALAMLLLATACAVRAAAPAVPAQRKIPDLHLRSVAGKSLPLHSLKDHQAIVVVFLSFECPVALSYTATLDALAKQYGPRKVFFIAIC